MKNLLILISALILVLLLVVYSNYNNSPKVQNDKNSISMKEAYRIAEKAVKKENPNALLYSITSTDSIENPEDSNAGKTGLRRYWNLIFMAPGTTDHWIIGIRDKRVKNNIKVQGGALDKSSLIDAMDSLIDSEDALKVAIKEYKLKPGEGWAIGYHFTLDKISGINIIQVFGRDSSGNFTKITINAETKEVIAAAHKISNDGVTYNWEILNPEP